MAEVRVVVQYTAESPAAADKRIVGMIDRCRKTEAEEPGCLQYEVFRSALRPTEFAMLERWESREALDQHLQRFRKNPSPPAPGITSVIEIYDREIARL